MNDSAVFESAMGIDLSGTKLLLRYRDQWVRMETGADFGAPRLTEILCQFIDAQVQALHYYRSLGVRITRIMTDNGTCYRSKRFRRLARRLGLRHLWTKPYTPRTNGKAERFIQTSLREWAYASSYNSSEQHAAHLLPWLNHYNWHRPHASLGYNPPISRAPLPLNNVLGLHT
jgi:transposase InsO family protein